jgi:predicted CDP-diglyceride synthetase/phosphatidate cytidylyltransferase
VDSLLNILKSAAPLLATAVAGPMGGVAVKAIADKLGVEDTVEAIAEHLTANPEAAAKLAEIDLEAYKLEVDDRRDARAMQVAAMQSDDSFVRRFTYYFIMFWSLFAIVLIPFMIFGSIPENNVRFADTILGFMLGTMVSSMFAFVLGSSFGSRQKDKK